jgi:hypothetical protein
MDKILNLTQHPASPEQIAAGTVEPDPTTKRQISELLTFHELPDPAEISLRAIKLAELAKAIGCDAAMIGGAPYLMGDLQAALEQHGVIPCFAFTTRESIEEIQKDGTTVKKSVFLHRGFVRVKPTYNFPEIAHQG